MVGAQQNLMVHTTRPRPFQGWFVISGLPGVISADILCNTPLSFLTYILSFDTIGSGLGKL